VSEAIKKIVFVTGTRADFGKLEQLAEASCNAGYRVIFFVTGMHMLSRYGLTKTEVYKNDKWEVVEFLNQREGDSQDIILAKTVTGFSDFLREAKPDLVVVHGDRVEALACSIVCSMNYIRSVHIEGGEVSGTIDESLRHATTKLSTFHLVSSKKARERILRMGEPPESISVIGSPELDFHSGNSGVSLQEVLNRYEIRSSNYGICIFHPVTSEQDSMRDQANWLFRNLIQSRRFFVVILPNNDPGAEEILKAIEELPSEQFRVLPSMRFSYFSELMKHAKTIIGNSSIGVREAPFVGVPSLDLGSRQTNRSCSLSITHCDPFDSDTLTQFLRSKWGIKHQADFSFGSGCAAEKFVTWLSQLTIWDSEMQKYFFDGEEPWSKASLQR